MDTAARPAAKYAGSFVCGFRVPPRLVRLFGLRIHGNIERILSRLDFELQLRAFIVFCRDLCSRCRSVGPKDGNLIHTRFCTADPIDERQVVMTLLINYGECLSASR